MSFTKKVVAGQDISSADFRQYFGDFFSEGIKTGFTVSVDSGLDLNVAAGTAYVKDASGGMFQVVSSGTETLTATASSTNYVYLHSTTVQTGSQSQSLLPSQAMRCFGNSCGRRKLNHFNDKLTSGLPSLRPLGLVHGQAFFLASHQVGYYVMGTTGRPI